MNPIDFGGRGQNSRSQWTYMEIETKPLCISLSNFADMLTMVNPIDLEVTVQRWRSRWVSLTNVGCAGMLRFALLYFSTLLSCMHYDTQNLDMYLFISGVFHFCGRNGLDLQQMRNKSKCHIFSRKVCLPSLITFRCHIHELVKVFELHRYPYPSCEQTVRI